ncbi:MAG: MFS transporter [Bacteroidetes bacterium]|nr:MFS transporter [Bacteroidota bacterium]
MEKKITIKGSPLRGLIGATFGFFIGFASVALFAPFIKNFKEVLFLTPAMIGLLVSIPNLSGSILRIPFSAMVDKNGGRKPFLILLGLASIGMLLLYLVITLYYPNNMPKHIYPFLLFIGCLCGCGIATFSVGVGQTAYWYPKNKHGVVLGIYAGVGNLAPGLFQLIFPLSFLVLGFAGTYLAWALFLIIGTIIYYFIAVDAWFFQLKAGGIGQEEAGKIAKKQYEQEMFPQGTLKRSLIISAKNWRTWVLVFIYFLSFGGFLALTVWFPSYWHFFYSLDIKSALLLTSIYATLASLIRVWGGTISDKFGGINIAIIFLVLTGIGAILMIFSSFLYLSISAMILMAIGMGVTNAAVFKLVPQSVPDAIGGAAGWIGGLGAFGGFVIPNILPIFIKTNNTGDMGYARGFVIFFVLSIVSIFLINLKKQKIT